MSAGATRSRSVVASSAAVPGDLVPADGSMLLMPTVPSDAVRRSTTHFVASLEMPPLVNVPASGIATPNTSTLSILRLMAGSPAVDRVGGGRIAYQVAILCQNSEETQMNTMAARGCAALLMLSGACAAGNAHAQASAYPSKTIRMIIALAPGGGV